MVTNVGALRSPDLQAPFGYLEHILSSSRTFFTGRWSQNFRVFCPKSGPNLWIFSQVFQKILFLKTFFRLLKLSVCCLTTRVGALESPDLQAPSRYLEHILSSSRKFFTGRWSQNFRVFWPKSDPNLWIFSQVCQKTHFFNFFRLLKRSVCCLTKRVGALESPDLQVPSRYLEHILSTSRKFFTGHWSQSFFEKVDQSQNSTWLKVPRLSFDFGRTFRKNFDFNGL